jgi:hypothetical protein
VFSARAGGGAISWGALRRVRRAGALTLTITFVLFEAVALAVTIFGLAFVFALGGIRYTIKLRKIKPRCLEPRQCHCAPQQLVWVT